MENGEPQQYRNNLSKEIKSEPDKEKRKEILAKVQKTEEYKISKTNETVESNNPEQFDVEKLPRSWTEYFAKDPEGVHKFIDDKAENNGIEKSEVEKILNDIVSVSKDLITKNAELRSKYGDIVDFEQGKLLESAKQKAKDEKVTNMRGSLVFESNIIVKEILTNIGIFSASNEAEANGVVRTAINDFISTEGQGRIYQKATFCKVKVGDMYEVDYRYWYWESGEEMLLKLSLKQGGAYPKFLDDNELNEKMPDIVYTAPKSGLYPAQLLKGGGEYLSKYRNVKKPFFTFPKNKNFTTLGFQETYYFRTYDDAHNALADSLEDLLSRYIFAKNDEERAGIENKMEDAIYNRDIEVNRIKHNEKQIDSIPKEKRDKYYDCAKSVINTVVSFQKAVEIIIQNNKDKKEIRVMFIDDSVNEGTTFSGMEAVVGIVDRYIKNKYGVDIRRISSLTYHEDSSYGGFPSHFAQQELELKKVLSKDAPMNHKTIRFFYGMANVAGYQMQARIDFKRRYKQTLNQ